MGSMKTSNPNCIPLSRRTTTTPPAAHQQPVALWQLQAGAHTTCVHYGSDKRVWPRLLLHMLSSMACLCDILALAFGPAALRLDENIYYSPCTHAITSTISDLPLHITLASIEWSQLCRPNSVALGQSNSNCSLPEQ